MEIGNRFRTRLQRTSRPGPAGGGLEHQWFASDCSRTHLPSDQPFCFWYGATEPHRVFEQGSGLRAGKQLASAPPPPFLPDVPEVRSDLLDYCLEIEWFDTHLGRMLKQLEDASELDNTFVIVTSDNGMSFPRTKAKLYEYGFHMLLAIRWAEQVPGGRGAV